MSCKESTRAPAFQKHWRESQYLWQSVSLPTFPQSSSLSPSLWSSLCSEKKKRKANSFPCKWSESLQPRGPVELQIFHLCLGASCYYSSAIIPSLSFFPLLLLSFYLSLSYLLTSAVACVDPPCCHLSLGLLNHSPSRKTNFTQFCTALKPFTAPALQSKITLLQSYPHFKLLYTSCCSSVPTSSSIFLCL